MNLELNIHSKKPVFENENCQWTIADKIVLREAKVDSVHYGETWNGGEYISIFFEENDHLMIIGEGIIKAIKNIKKEYIKKDND